MKAKRIMPSSKIKKKPLGSRTAFGLWYALEWKKVLDKTGGHSKKEMKEIIRKIVGSRLKTLSDKDVEWLASRKHVIALTKKARKQKTRN